MAKGKFKSERQRRFLWATNPAAARKWAHGQDTTKGDWTGKKVASARRRKRK